MNENEHTGPRNTMEQAGPGESNQSLVAPELVVSAHLTVVNGKDAGRVFGVLGRETLIGRIPLAHVRLEDKSISSRHAKILRAGQNLHRLIDLGSTNGTFLNGERLEANHPMDVGPGDTIQVGETVLSYAPNTREFAEGQTQYLAHVTVQPKTTDLSLPDVQSLAQLLKLTGAVPEAQAPGPTLDERIDSIMRLLGFVRKHLTLLVALTVICALIGDASAFIAPPPSEATFLLRVSPPGTDTERSEQTTQDFYATVEQDFMNPRTVEQTLVALGEKKPSTKRIADTTLALKFESNARQVYVGSFKDPDARYAVDFLDKHLENYLSGQVQKTLRVVHAQVDFLGARLKEREDELRQIEGQLKEFKAKHLEGLPEYTTQHITSREGLYTRKAELSAQLSRTNLELGLARKRLSEASPLLVKRVENASPYQQSIVEVTRKLSEARSKGLGESHPEVMTLNSQLSDLKRLADRARNTDSSELERSANPGLIDLKNRVADLEVGSRGAGAELGEINAQLSRLSSLVGAMPEIEAKYAQLTRSYAASKDLHAKLFEQLKTSQLQLELERTSAKARYEIISAPQSSGVAMRKTLALRTAVGAAAGLVLWVIVVTFLQMRDYMRARKRRSTAIVPHTGGRGPPALA